MLTRANILAAIMITAAYAAPALAQQPQASDVCARTNLNYSPDQWIAACTSLIQSGRMTGKELAATYYNRAFGYYVKRQYDRAIADFDQSIRLDPNNVHAYFNRGSAHNKKGQYDRAIADFDQTLRLDPQHDYALFDRGNAYLGKGQYDRAIADYDQLIQRNPGDLVLAARGNAYFNKRDYDRAIADYDAALNNDAKHAAALYGRGMSKLRKSDAAGGNADIAAAKALNAGIAAELAQQGVK